ncbi:family 78 glycoside hydrolase catalytic domain [Nesterenkonia sp. K-15-9-6]|uniref:family 78 glycoside hydrolase catalytic domain n=1 Tax=Nesterenkonia sp. K-15-9-6 TaxID=3093918 RepID=UPI0040442252
MTQHLATDPAGRAAALPPLTAEAITPARPVDTAPRFRRAFTLDTGHGGVARATLRASALGVYEAQLDEVPVSEDVLAPGWSSYEWRLRYQTYDITPQLRADSSDDEHVLTATVGNGWYLGQLGWQERRRLYGEHRGLIMQLDVEYDDGHVQSIRTDTSWTASGSEILSDDLYDGQTIDARQRGQDTDQVPVRTLEVDAELMEPLGPPVRRQQEIAPQRIWTSPSGKTLVDFGQNLVGWIRMTASGAPGETITVRHAEVLEHDELGTRPLRHADATDRFVLSGGRDTFEPTFTFHGFRYAEVTGYPGELTADALTAVVVHSEMPRTGTFRSSHDLVNRLHENVVWGLRGNFLDVPTDCPQRDERLGWTGDIAVFAPAAAHLYDVHGFLADWLRDLDAEQRAADGFVPYVVPDALKYQDMPEEFQPVESAAIWSDAAVWVPWALWEATGEADVLAAQYDSMTAHLRRVESRLSPTGLWDQDFQFGDWLDPDASPHEPWNAKADRAVVATACVVRTARMVAESAQILGRDDDAATFRALADRVQAAFLEHYVDAEGRIRSDSTTVYTLAIVFDLLDGTRRAAAGERLAELVRQAEFRVSTGFAGTPYITEALSRTGHTEEAYGLLLETGCPSWLYPVTMGATTIWERWDSMLPDGSINPGEMTSFNHYALGSVAAWMHRVVGGLAPAAPGYARVRVAPQPPVGVFAEEITWAETTQQTPHGLVSVAWRRDGEALVLTVELPEGVAADVDLSSTFPQSEPAVLGAGRHELRFG